MTRPHTAIRLALTSLSLVISACCYTQHPPQQTPGFWGPDDFQGSYDSPNEPVINAETTYEGDIVFANLPRTVVGSVLPSDLQLATNVGDMQSQHPIVLVFGSQTKPRSIIPPINGANDYHEMILVIPFVQKVGSQKWHNYVVRMYLDWQMGVDGGNLLYGYRKEMADLARTPQLNQPPEFIFDISQAKTARFTAQVTGVSAWMDDQSAKTALTNYEAMKVIFDMPILGTWPASYGMASPYVCSYFVWTWQGATVRSASTRLQFLSEFVPNMTQWVAAGPISNLPNGDWGVQGLTWQLTSPKTCAF
jgi:hypothetical protein